MICDYKQVRFTDETKIINGVKFCGFTAIGTNGFKVFGYVRITGSIRGDLK